MHQKFKLSFFLGAQDRKCYLSFIGRLCPVIGKCPKVTRRFIQPKNILGKRERLPSKQSDYVEFCCCVIVASFLKNKTK
jgi:hypothetical protein